MNLLYRVALFCLAACQLGCTSMPHSRQDSKADHESEKFAFIYGGLVASKNKMTVSSDGACLRELLDLFGFPLFMGEPTSWDEFPYVNVCRRKNGEVEKIKVLSKQWKSDCFKIYNDDIILVPEF